MPEAPRSCGPSWPGGHESCAEIAPSGQSAGKDFGIWHACMVAPQIIGPLSTGLLISAIRSVASASLAYEAAFALGALWFVLGAALVGRVRIPVAS